MKNGEKYKGAKQRTAAFAAFCLRHDWCRDCAANDMRNAGYCEFAWLELPANDKPGRPRKVDAVRKGGAK